MMGVCHADWTIYTTALPVHLAMVSLFILILIVVNNILVLVTFKHMVNLQLQHYLMIGLVIADLMNIFSYAAIVVTIAEGQIMLTDCMCSVITALNHTFIGATSWIHSVMSLDKCMSSVKPFRHKIFASSEKAQLVAAFLVAICFVMPLGLITYVLRLPGIAPLFNDQVPSWGLPVDFRVLGAFAGFFIIIPIIIQLSTGAVIVWKVCSLMSYDSRRKILRAVSSLALTLALYYSCWIPFVAHICYAHFSGKPPGAIIFLSVHAIFLNSAMSFFIYMVTLPKFRAAWMKKICTRRNLVGVNG